MCTICIQQAFHRLYVGLCIALCALGIFLVATRPPLHTELFMVQPKPVNGSLQVIMCRADVKIKLADGTVAQHCEYTVDHANRLQVTAYHVSMGVPCILVCLLGCFFALTTSKENAMHGIMSSTDLLFIVETYSMEMKSASHHHNTLYRWECIFWGYVFWVHLVIVLMLASPVDVFDCMVIISFQILCIMYLCRPRQCDAENALWEVGNKKSNSSWFQGFVFVLLLFIAWNSFASIPHAYEGERIWSLVVLLAMDILLLVVHMYDHMPTMYTICMGRLLYTIVLNACVICMFATFHHRLVQYSEVSTMV